MQTNNIVIKRRPITMRSARLIGRVLQVDEETQKAQVMYAVYGARKMRNPVKVWEPIKNLKVVAEK